MRVTIEKLVYGGSGMARTGEGVVFVPRTLPGEVVEVEIVNKKRDYAVGRIVEILTKSGDRREPFCPNYETAGCCHWQHIAYERQLDFKEAILRESLERLGRLRWDGPIHRISGPDRNYRLRAAFHVVDRKLGYMQENTRRVAPIRECSALIPELDRFVVQCQAIIERPGFETLRQVRVVASPDVPAWAATFVSADGRLRHLHQGNPVLTVSGVQYRLDPDTFFQSNAFLLPRFISEVLCGPVPLWSAFDLYCGSGFFSLPLARVFTRVTGVESRRASTRDARENARINKLSNVEFVHANVSMFLSETSLRPEVVLVNPPRSGAGRENVASIANLKPKKVVYVSCNPTTLAPEAAVLVAHGYGLRRLTLLDQFPHTYHIETIAVFDCDSDTTIRRA